MPVDPTGAQAAAHISEAIVKTLGRSVLDCREDGFGDALTVVLLDGIDPDTKQLLSFRIKVHIQTKKRNDTPNGSPVPRGT